MDTVTTSDKCREILEAIVAACGDENEKSIRIGFGPDWGGNTLTVYRGYDHTHVGDISAAGTFEALVDQLHDLLIKGRGLSWAQHE